jgi:hypothetical protein
MTSSLSQSPGTLSRGTTPLTVLKPLRIRHCLGNRTSLPSPSPLLSSPAVMFVRRTSSDMAPYAALQRLQRRCLAWLSRETLSIPFSCWTDRRALALGVFIERIQCKVQGAKGLQFVARDKNRRCSITCASTLGFTICLCVLVRAWKVYRAPKMKHWPCKTHNWSAVLWPSHPLVL